jgi:hypothetical protein
MTREYSEMGPYVWIAGAYLGITARSTGRVSFDAGRRHRPMLGFGHRDGYLATQDGENQVNNLKTAST